MNTQLLNKFKRFKVISFLFRMISPGFGTCNKCGLPWNHCQEKTTYYGSHSGTFATCQYCWDNSTLDELKIYYSKTYTNQMYSMMRFGGKMDHSRLDLLDAVEKEYNKETMKRRKQKVLSIKRTLKKNHKKNVALFRED